MICDVIEQAFRNYAYGDAPLRPMTADERAWCVASADHAGEGSVRVEELTQLDDREHGRQTGEGVAAMLFQGEFLMIEDEPAGMRRAA